MFPLIFSVICLCDTKKKRTFAQYINVQLKEYGSIKNKS